MSDLLDDDAPSLVYGDVEALQPREWTIVLGHVRSFDDALALQGLIEIADEELYANELPASTVVTGAAICSNRGFASFLAAYLRHLDPGTTWT